MTFSIAPDSANKGHCEKDLFSFPGICVSLICRLQDKTAGTQLTVMTDRSNGGSSIHDGMLEVMVMFQLLFKQIFYQYSVQNNKLSALI